MHAEPLRSFARTDDGSAVIWTKANPQPWNTVRENDRVKLMAINQDFDQK